jgi:hypothetical protein
MTNESYFHHNETYNNALNDEINYAKTPIPSRILSDLESKSISSKFNESTIPLNTNNFLTTLGVTLKYLEINGETKKAITYNNKEKEKFEILEKKTKTEKKKTADTLTNNNDDDEKDSPFFDDLDLDLCNLNKEEKDSPFFDDINSYLEKSNNTPN